jgi:hypothetical protein
MHSQLHCCFRLFLIAGVALLLAVPGFAQRRPSGESAIWTGQSGGFTLTWTSGDIIATPTNEPARVIFSAKDIAQKKFLAFKKENLEDQPSWRCTYSLKFTVLGLVGSLLSYEENEDSYCGQVNGPGWNHPADQIHYRVIDLKQASASISLAKFFEETEVLEALLADSTVKEALANAGKSTVPKSVVELVKTINEEAEIKPIKGSAEAPKECGFVFPEHPFTEFAFHHIENGKVAVRLSLEPNSGACHSAHSQLGILLKIPSAIAALLTAAQSRSEGFLMDSGRRLSAGKATVFDFETSPLKK